MKACTSHIIEWDPTQEKYVTLPKNCLSYIIVNQGNSQVMIDNSIVLNPNENYPVSNHSGYYHTGQIKLRVSNDQTPFSDNTKVLIRLILGTA